MFALRTLVVVAVCSVVALSPSSCQATMSHDEEMQYLRAEVQHLRGRVEHLENVLAKRRPPPPPPPPPPPRQKQRPKVPRVSDKRTTHYLLYDVNTQEGFNLRRDVLLRVLMLTYDLNHDDASPPQVRQLNDWTLVLPPFRRMYHWDQDAEPVDEWGLFFNLTTLATFVPVITYGEYSKLKTSAAVGPMVDHVLYLESKPFDTNRVRQYGVDVVSCDGVRPLEGGCPWRRQQQQQQQQRDHYISHKCSYTNLNAAYVHCWTVFAPYASFGIVLREMAIAHEREGMLNFTTTDTVDIDLNQVDASRYRLQQHHVVVVGGGDVTTDKTSSSSSSSTGVSVLVDRVETLFWDGRFGRSLYWRARQSVRWADALYAEARRFRAQHIGANTPYLGVHLRRRDFVYAHQDSVPSLTEAALKMQQLCQSYNLKAVYIATDGSLEDVRTIRAHLPSISVWSYRHFDNDDVTRLLHNGQQAIVDQILCSMSTYFIGTRHSTFSHVIMQERELTGMSASTTYNSFCSTAADTSCEQPGRFPFVIDEE